MRLFLLHTEFTTVLNPVGKESVNDFEKIAEQISVLKMLHYNAL